MKCATCGGREVVFDPEYTSEAWFCPDCVVHPTPEWASDPVQLARWRYWIEHDAEARSWPPPDPRKRVQ